MANFNALVATVVRMKRRMDDAGGKLFVAQRELTQAENDHKHAVADLDDAIHKACMPEAHPARALPEGVDLPPPVIEVREHPVKTIAAKVARAQSAPVVDGKRSIRCGHCHKPGHHKYRCPERKTE